jgi:pyruvate formate lyase activating enzyme
MTEWIAGLKGSNGNTIGTEVPLHISRFFPRFHMTDRDATRVKLVYRLADVARERLKYVYTGNC